MEIFEYWKLVSGHSKAEPIPERLTPIKRALKRFTPEQLRQVIDSIEGDPFFKGENDRNRPYDFPEIFFSKDSKIEQRLAAPANGNGRRTPAYVEE